MPRRPALVPSIVTPFTGISAGGHGGHRSRRKSDRERIAAATAHRAAGNLRRGSAASAATTARRGVESFAVKRGQYRARDPIELRARRRAARVDKPALIASGQHDEAEGRP